VSEGTWNDLITPVDGDADAAAGRLPRVVLGQDLLVPGAGDGLAVKPKVLRRSEWVDLNGVKVPHWWQRKPLLNERDCRLYIGKRGSGKSLAAVEEACARLDRGERLLSNIRIRSPRTGRCSEPFLSWDQLYDEESGEYASNLSIFLDEAMAWLDSRDYKEAAAYGKWVMREWEQSRKRGVGYILTAIDYGSVEKRMRTLLDKVCLCEPTWFSKHTRLPLYRRAWLDPYDMLMLQEGNQVPQHLVEEKGGLAWVPDYAFHAFDSHDTVGSCEWKEIKRVDRSARSLAAS